MLRTPPFPGSLPHLPGRFLLPPQAAAAAAQEGGLALILVVQAAGQAAATAARGVGLAPVEQVRAGVDVPDRVW